MRKLEREKLEAIARLREIVKPGDMVYTILAHVSTSGMLRVIRLIVMKDGEPRDISWNVAKALGDRLDEKKNGVRVTGCGMDMGYHLVSALSYALHGMKGARCKKHAASDAPSVSGRSCGTAKCFEVGYTLRHGWL